ncbi:MAG: CDP-alcohol phosphatidyltransferase family protein [Oscillospiraceae bacterium]|jgi:CDP-diacylglycerol--glycerol-3-phosphate 3-phosphatidyltransferase|nr:CDP-alcohol phosphatidyltransferase family protein [Oscillospiraceae bacterium]
MEKIRQENNLNIPNALTVLRLVLLPLFALRYLAGDARHALIIYVLVQLSDFLDGFIARRLGQITSFGKLMDPLADKLLLLTALVCFGVKGRVPWGVIALVLGKECLMIAGGIFALRRRIVVQAKMVGKVSTALFAAAVVCFLLGWSPWNLLLLYAGVAVTLAALAFYIVNFWKMLHPHEKKEA